MLLARRSLRKLIRRKIFLEVLWKNKQVNGLDAITECSLQQANVNIHRFITDSIEKFKKNFQPLVCPFCSLTVFTFGDASCEFKDNKDKDPRKQFSKRSSFISSANLGKKTHLFSCCKIPLSFFSHLAPKLLNVERSGLMDSFGNMWLQSSTKWTTSVEVSLFCLAYLSVSNTLKWQIICSWNSGPVCIFISPLVFYLRFSSDSPVIWCGNGFQ